MGDDLHTKEGQVLAFDYETGRGVVALREGGSVEFCSFDFHGDDEPRFPRIGEIVEVLFQRSRMVMVASEAE